MLELYNGSTQVLHFQCDFCCINHVYTIKDKSQETVLQTIKDFASYIQRQQNYKVKIFFLNGEQSLGKEQDNQVNNKGYKIQVTPPYIAELNGGIKQLGCIIITQLRALKEASNLLQGIWLEIFRTARYLVNRSPLAVIDYKTLYRLLLQSLLSQL